MRRLALIVFALTSETAVAQSIPPEAAEEVFQTAVQLNARDGGRLWGMPVCGAILLMDASTHDVVANQADAQGMLQKNGTIWRGKLPEDVTASNTAIEQYGVRWTMLAWPVSNDPRDRQRLIGHECFHRIQEDLKLQPPDTVATHLDDKDGRIWIQLEWRALERALATSGDLRRAAIADAVRFRGYRRALVKSAAASENAQEMNEGVAEYTGIRLANPNEADRRAAAICALRAGPQKQGFGRSFAYVSGPAYGILLDAADVGWRKKLTPETDWGGLLASAYDTPKATIAETAILKAAREYDGETLIAAETQRAVKLEARRAEVRKKFVDGPVLVLPIDEKFAYGFDPGDTLSLDENSTLYGRARITGEWGVLEANSGALMTRKNGEIVRVVVPAARSAETAASDDWRLTLNSAWKIAATGREGDQALQKR